MTKAFLAIVVGESGANVQTIREALTSAEEQLTLQHVERARTALARVAGGGVGIILLDICEGAENKGREAFAALRAGAPEIPVIVLCDAREEPTAKQMVDEGAAGYVVRANWQKELKERVLASAARQQSTAARVERSSGAKGSVLAVVGAKGGVGATTVAVNVASLLASSSKVILAELRPPFGTLCHFFRPHRAARSLQNLLAINRADLDLAEVESCLWPNRNIPGLSVLFSPEKAANAAEIESEQIVEILGQLARLGEVVVIDLPQSLSDASRAILKNSDTLMLVVERDVLSVDAAKAKVTALESLAIIPPEAGLVIVNRVPLAAPMALPDIESELGLPVFAVIPPAADLCAAAYRVHIPVVKLDAQSSIATSFAGLAKKLSCRL